MSITSSWWEAFEKVLEKSSRANLFEVAFKENFHWVRGWGGEEDVAAKKPFNRLNNTQYTMLEELLNLSLAQTMIFYKKISQKHKTLIVK